MKRIDNPHIDADHGPSGLAGPAGSCPGHVHAFSDDGIEHQCVLCGTVTLHAWRDVEDHAIAHAEMFPSIDSVKLPPCKKCGACCHLNHSNVEYGVDLPHHYTLAAAKMIAKRPRVRGKIAVNAHAEHERYQGSDFSHLPEKQRPAHHVPPSE